METAIKWGAITLVVVVIILCLLGLLLCLIVFLFRLGLAIRQGWRKLRGKPPLEPKPPQKGTHSSGRYPRGYGVDVSQED